MAQVKQDESSITIDNYPYTVELRPCGDCAVLPGYAHTDGCDVARCPECGEQRLQCEEHADNEDPSIWTGIWPGVIECVEYDLWSKWVDKEGNSAKWSFGDGSHWEKTTRNDPNRSPNLNALHELPLVWNKQLQRFFVDRKYLK